MTARSTDAQSLTDHGRAKGLRQFLDPEQQRAWMGGKANPPDAAARPESLEHRFKYVARFEKLLSPMSARLSAGA